MPELPEVEFTARQLRASVVGATITEAQVFWERTIGHPGLPDFLAEVADRRILDVRRRGKYLLLDLSGQLFLSIHRRMTGNLLLLPPGWEIDTSRRETDPVTWNLKGPTFRAAEQPIDQGRNAHGSESGAVAVDFLAGSRPIHPAETSYCRVCFNLADGRRLLYTDPRKFGRIELWANENEADGEVLAPPGGVRERARKYSIFGLGLEPLSEEFTVEQLANALSVRKGAIKQVLLTQDVVAGLGNIYADEALYYASIHPLRRANSLATGEIEKLHVGIIAVLTRGIEHGGTSFSGYRDLQGEPGDNYDHLQAYFKHGTVKMCVRCGTQIERIIIAQRSAHFCPFCQKLTSE